MLTPQQLATLRAALHYWQQEMCPHGTAAMRPYLDVHNLEPLGSAEVAQLRKRLTARAIRYGHCRRGSRGLASTKLFSTMNAAAQQANQDVSIATVVLPRPAQ